MKKPLTLAGIVFVAVLAMMLLSQVVAGAESNDAVYLRDYDPGRYEEMVQFYRDAGFSETEAVDAASRITINVEPTPTPTASPTPTPTPPPTPTPTPQGGILFLYEYDPALYGQIRQLYIDAGMSVEEATEAANRITVNF